LKKSQPVPAPEPPRSEILLEEIRDALAKKGSPPAASPARAERLLEEIRDALAKGDFCWAPIYEDPADLLHHIDEVAGRQ
jgi:large-conductance mechanosensitive channel